MASQHSPRLIRLLDHLDTKSPIEMLLRGHLWVEQELRAALRQALPRAEHLEAGERSINYSLLVRLCAAHGLIRGSEIGGYNALGRLRNKLAHDVDVAIAPADARDLVNALGPFTRHMYDGPALELADELAKDWLNGLRFSVMALFIELEIEREKLEHAHERLRTAAQRLLDVAGERPTST